MYENFRSKAKQPEVNMLRTCPLEPNNYSRQLLSMNHSSSSPGQPLDPERITRQYQQLQYCNYITYVTLMEQATGQTYNPDPAMGVNASLFPVPSSQRRDMQRIEGIPPGRPAGMISQTREETYGQYKMRTDPNYTAPSRDYDPRNGRNNYERKFDSETVKKAPPVAQDDWDDDGPSEPKKVKTAEPNDDGWNDFLPSDDSNKPGITKAETKPLVSNDDWGDDEKVPVSSTPKKKSDDNGWSDDEGKTSSFGSGFGSSNNRESSFGSRGYQGSRDSRGGRDGSVRTPQEGDWNCTQCKGYNFKNRVECFKCKEPKGDAQPATTTGGSYQGSRDNNQGGRDGSVRTPQYGDWDCTQCKANNFKNRVECFKCKEPKGDAQPTTITGGGYQGSRDNNRGGRDGSVRTPQDGDWSCIQCKANNFKHRVECFRCKEPMGDAQPSTTSGGVYQGSRDNNRGSRDGYRGGFRGGSRGGYNNQSRGGSFKRNDAKPVKSGWSDEEGDKEDESKPKVVMPSGGDDWDVEEPKAVKKRPADKDDTGDEKPPAAKKPSRETGDTWDSGDDKKVEIKAAADDGWDEFTAPAKINKKIKKEKPDKKRPTDQPSAQSHAVTKSIAQVGNSNDDWDIFETNSSGKSKSGTTNDDDDWGV